MRGDTEEHAEQPSSAYPVMPTSVITRESFELSIGALLPLALLRRFAETG